MKKLFVEPKIKRIELNMKENIANSQSTGMMGYYFNEDVFCTIQDTNYNLGHIYMGTIDASEVDGCRISARAKIGRGTIVPNEQIVPYLRR